MLEALRWEFDSEAAIRRRFAPVALAPELRPMATFRCILEASVSVPSAHRSSVS